MPFLSTVARMVPRTPLLHPRQYFEQRGFAFAPAAAAVGVAALSLVAVLAGFGVLLSNRLENAGEPGAASAVWGAIGGYLVGIVVLLFVGWLLAAGVLHLLARAAVGHDGRFEQTLVVVGWGTAPTALTSLVAFAFLASALGDASMASPEAFVSEFQSNVRGTSLVRNTVSFLVAGWEVYVYANGLGVAFDDHSGSTWLVAGVVAYGGWLLSLF